MPSYLLTSLILLAGLTFLGAALLADTSLFAFLAFLTGWVALGTVFLAYRKSRDSFHPSIYLGLMLFFLYSYLPLYLFYTDAAGLGSFLSAKQLQYVQGLNLLGVISLCAGALSGDHNVKFRQSPHPGWMIPPTLHKRINRAAIFLGLIGVSGFLYGLANVGGLSVAYGRGYGGGAAVSGYLREAFLLTLPALLWLMATHVFRKLSSLDWAWIFLFASPLLVHGLLGARRGPTFMITVALIISWYLIRFRRPALRTVIVGGICLGFLLLFLVTNRSEIYLGSELRLQSPPTGYLQAHSGNEYIYGAGTILNADIKGEYFWGKRYFTIFFIRPIPRALWPSKYADASRLLGIPNLAEGNLGTGGVELAQTLGWPGAVGAAPGIVADMWLEFCWFAFPVLFAIGWLYGMAWRKAVSRGGLWIPIYTLMTALSIYLVMQTLEAMAFRFLLTAAAVWLIWRYGVAGQPKQAKAYLSTFDNHSLHH